MNTNSNTLSQEQNQNQSAACRTADCVKKAETFLTPLASVAETADGYVLEAEMPGVAKDGLELTVENDQLTVIGRRAKAEAPGQLLYRESRGQSYRRVFQLDNTIDAGKISARIERGVLRLVLPKAESVKPRNIAVE